MVTTCAEMSATTAHAGMRNCMRMKDFKKRRDASEAKGDSASMPETVKRN